MSVQVPDLMVYEYVHNGLTVAANRKECDNLFSTQWRKYFKNKLWDEESKRLVLSWAKLNEDSYNAAYSNEGAYLVDFLTCSKLIKVNALQLVKYVHCVAYNIELDTIKQKLRSVTHQEYLDFKLLIDWRAELYKNIVTCSPAYDKLPYSDYQPEQWEPGAASEWIGM